jgi:hypothetical protein
MEGCMFILNNGSEGTDIYFNDSFSFNKSKIIDFCSSSDEERIVVRDGDSSNIPWNYDCLFEKLYISPNGDDSNNCTLDFPCERFNEKIPTDKFIYYIAIYLIEYDYSTESINIGDNYLNISNSNENNGFESSILWNSSCESNENTCSLFLIYSGGISLKYIYIILNGSDYETSLIRVNDEGYGIIESCKIIGEQESSSIFNTNIRLLTLYNNTKFDFINSSIEKINFTSGSPILINENITIKFINIDISSITINKDEGFIKTTNNCLLKSCNISNIILNNNSLLYIDTTFEMNDCIFSNISSDERGGVIEILNNTNVNIKNSKFINYSCSGRDGSIILIPNNNNHINIKSSTFEGIKTEHNVYYYYYYYYFLHINFYLFNFLILIFLF